MSDKTSLEKKVINLEKRVEKLEKKYKKTTNTNETYDSETTISELIDNSFFTKEKKFMEIIKQLKINATFSKNGNYKKALETLIQKKKLKRRQFNHQWVYVKYG